MFEPDLDIIPRMSLERKRHSIPDVEHEYKPVMASYLRVFAELKYIAILQNVGNSTLPDIIFKNLRKDLSHLRDEVHLHTKSKDRRRTRRLGDPREDGKFHVYNPKDGNVYYVDAHVKSSFGNQAIYERTEIKPEDPIIPFREWGRDPGFVLRVANAMIKPIPTDQRDKFVQTEL